MEPVHLWIGLTGFVLGYLSCKLRTHLKNRARPPDTMRDSVERLIAEKPQSSSEYRVEDLRRGTVSPPVEMD